MGDAAQEEPPRDVGDRGGEVDTLVVIAHEPPPASHPAEGPLDDSSTWRHFEARLAVVAAHDLEDEILERCEHLRWER